MAEVYRVYVLQNQKGRRYIGFSEDVVVRIKQHNSGMTTATRGRGPWKLVWQSDRLEHRDARRLELDLKRQKGGNGFYQLTGLTKPQDRSPPRRGSPRNQFFVRGSPLNQITCRMHGRAQSSTPLIRARKRFQSSSVVERSAVNRLVVGSNPTSGAVTSSLPAAYAMILLSLEAVL
jgi:predicted GIY-YIG superfamily endonuclease